VSRTLTSTELKRLHRDRRREVKTKLALVFDDVQNPFNVGSISRSAAAYGVEHLWLTAASCQMTHPKVQKTALGSQRFVQWTVTDTISEALAAANDAGYTTVGLELAEGAQSIDECDLTGNVAIVVGHEDRGISKEGLAGCDQLVYLPLIGKIGSLNVAMATNIALYEARRQAWSAQG
jgi:tRNA (guanosine-2'-O-)-methyltransferase